MAVRYWLMLRPPSIGTHPDGESGREVWSPGRRIEELPGDWRAHGFVEYPEALTFDQAWRYDLLPADRLERFRFNLWRRANRPEDGNLSGEIEIVREYASNYSEEDLREYARYNDYADLAVELLDLERMGVRL